MKNTSIYKTPESEKIIMAFYDSIMQRWPVSYETRNISTRYGNTFVIVSGQASLPPLVLLHGAGTNSASWARDIRAYSASYRTYAVDLLGEAGHSAPNRPDWNSSAYAEWLEDVLDALQIDRTVLIGLSQGGWVALKYAVARPERIEKLVLISPGGILPDRISFVLRAIFYALSGSRGSKRMAKMLYADQLVSEESIKMISIMMRHFRSRTGILPLFSDEELQRLTMPTLLLGGTKDALRNMGKIAERLRKFLPHLQVLLLPGAGHVIVKTSEHILPFLLSQEAMTDTRR